MATNDFLPFAVGGSANVVSQSAYAALAALSNGYQSGVANSAQINKTFRQGSIMAAVLAQFIVNQTGQNATDDGTTATLLTNLLAAVKSASNAVVGAARNLAMSVSAASASATLTADEIIVESALGGLSYKLASFSKTVNLATTGAGGMDAGTAPVSGFVALYAIYNPTTGASALLATNATSAVQPNVYGGANMPSGYAASALISVWPTNGSSQFAPGLQQDRAIYTVANQVLTTTSLAQSVVPLSISSAVPPNAREIVGYMSATASSGQGGYRMTLGQGPSQFGVQFLEPTLTTAAPTGQIGFSRIPIASQLVYYTIVSTGLTAISAQIFISGYAI